MMNLEWLIISSLTVIQVVPSVKYLIPYYCYNFLHTYYGHYGVLMVRLTTLSSVWFDSERSDVCDFQLTGRNVLAVRKLTVVVYHYSLLKDE